MMTRPTSTQRRTAAQWGALVRAWGRSGVSAREFASSRGISARTLSWWKWRLSKDAASQASVTAPTGVQLVPVEIIDDGASGDECWELLTATGHLRVHGALSAPELHAVLDAMGLRRGKA